MKSRKKRAICFSQKLINKIINEEMRNLGLKQIPKAYRKDLMIHLVDVVYVSIRSELLRYVNYKDI